MVSFNDWGFDEDVDNVVESARGFWPGKKKHGAVNMRATVMGEKTLRTMTMWTSQEQLEVNIDGFRAAASSAVGVTLTGGMIGALALGLD